MQRATASLLMAGWLAVAAVLAGCDQSPTVPLRVGTNVWPGYEPLYLARDLGYYRSKDIYLVEYTSSSEVIRAFRNQAIDGAALTLDEVFLLAQDGFQPRVVLVMDESAGGDAILGQPGMRSVEDLKGQRVAVESTALGAYVLSRALELHGMTTSQVRVAHLEANEHARAFEAGEVAGVVTFDPAKSRLLEDGAVLLFDSTKLPGEIVDVLVVRDSYVRKHEQLVSDLIEGWFAALKHLDTDPADAAARMAKREQVDAETLLRSLKGMTIPSRTRNQRMLGGKSPELVNSGEKLMQHMLGRDLLKRTVKVADLLWSEPLAAPTQ